MKKIILILILCLLLFCVSVKASLPLSGKVVFIDPGHGGKDPGTSYGKVLEKDLNLQISLKLRNELIRNGASVLMSRDGDYDLSSSGINRRKKNDFDNRINLINKSRSDVYLSIHINYLADSFYSGGQVFYYTDKNKELAETIQKEFNSISYPRSIKEMPDIYMYRRLKVNGVLVECGFISNKLEREKLVSDSYQNKIAVAISKGLINYFT